MPSTTPGCCAQSRVPVWTLGLREAASSPLWTLGSHPPCPTTRRCHCEDLSEGLATDCWSSERGEPLAKAPPNPPHMSYTLPLPTSTPGVALDSLSLSVHILTAILLCLLLITHGRHQVKVTTVSCPDSCSGLPQGPLLPPTTHSPQSHCHSHLLKTQICLHYSLTICLQWILTFSDEDPNSLDNGGLPTLSSGLPLLPHRPPPLPSVLATPGFCASSASHSLPAPSMGRALAGAPCPLIWGPFSSPPSRSII